MGYNFWLALGIEEKNTSTKNLSEYVSVDKECYYLDTICIDLETGNQVDYEKILEGCCNE